MKFGKQLERQLEAENLPEEWVEAAIQYKALKKCINMIVGELEILGLSKATSKLLLGSEEVDISPENRKLAQYTLTKGKSGTSIVPRLEILPGDDVHPEIWSQLRQRVESNAHVVNEPTNSVIRPTITEIKDDGTIVVSLHSDVKFFTMLENELSQLDELREREERKLLTECESISEQVKTLSSPSQSRKDLYAWRELFRVYIDSEVYFRYNESNSSAAERDSDKIEQNLEQFLLNMRQSKILDKFSQRQSLSTFNRFVAMNFHLLKMLQFQQMNSTALRKILKKFDKQTNFGIKNTFPRLVSDDHVFIKGGSLAQSICYVIQSQILALVPQLEDYTCPVCMSIAYKPIQLDCGHRFCVRCLVKMKQQEQGDCPICRSSRAIMAADGSHLDVEAMKKMEVYFPIEVKQKLRERNQEKFRDWRGGSQDKCHIM
ncbi:hypothetical protein DIURU_002138 [Diutina rugosa]|uniref:Uncharacterized protein n=1 Tax=Diutina rugosa TaxID=5481 RepID=A0A642URF6_DIURU|nr:uncharacterized protein DIURU_002138 [Diutina rugosa]KAA8903916.1 hypothetical protein DIURU_002138 [Diutina rugosa]